MELLCSYSFSAIYSQRRVKHERVCLKEKMGMESGGRSIIDDEVKKHTISLEG